MKLAIYAPANTTLPMILAPECMQPSLGCEQRYGQLRLVGTVSLDDSVVQAFGESISPVTGNIEYLVNSETARAAVKALMERAHEAQHPGRLGIAGGDSTT